MCGKGDRYRPVDREKYEKGYRKAFMRKPTWTKKISGYLCKRCGHKWLPRIKDPRQCPKCKTAYWDKEKE